MYTFAFNQPVSAFALAGFSRLLRFCEGDISEEAWQESAALLNSQGKRQVEFLAPLSPREHADVELSPLPLCTVQLSVDSFF